MTSDRHRLVKIGRGGLKQISHDEDGFLMKDSV